MLEIKQHDAKFSHINLREERHGDRRILAVDLSLQFEGPNVLLNGIDPDLRTALYRAPDSGDQADFVNEQKAKESGIDDGLVARRIACVPKVPITQELEAYEVAIRGQLKRSKSIKLVDCKIKGLVVRALDGGSVEISLKASSTVDPDELAVLGKLLLIGDVRLSLTPPDSDDAGMDDDDENADADADSDEDEEQGEDDDHAPPGDLLDEQDAADPAPPLAA